MIRPAAVLAALLVFWSLGAAAKPDKKFYRGMITRNCDTRTLSYEKDCCIRSAKLMEKGGYKPVAKGAGDCPKGRRSEALGCLGSFRWCVPDGAKRPAAPPPRKSAAHPPKSYYDYLESQCPSRGAEKCCRAAVKKMREKGRREPGREGCAEGLVQGKLSCKGSYRWCVPAPKGYKPPKPLENYQAKVVGVSDGGTLVVVRKGRKIKVRLYGIVAPEKNQPYGKAARTFTSQMTLGKDVLVEIRNKSLLGGRMAQVYVDNKSLNHELVRAGMAKWNRRQLPEDVRFEQMEGEAKKAGVGLWRKKLK